MNSPLQNHRGQRNTRGFEDVRWGCTTCSQIPERPAASPALEALLGNWEVGWGSAWAARESWKDWEISHFPLSWFCLSLVLQVCRSLGSAGAHRAETLEACPSWHKETAFPPGPQW